MNVNDKLIAQKQKLENLCEEHNLTYGLDLYKNPARLTLRPLQGMYEQISMLENAEDGKPRISQDAYKTFYAQDAEYGVVSDGHFDMDTDLERKFLNIFKKIDIFWKCLFTQECISTGAIKKGMMPVISEEESEKLEENTGDQSGEEAELEEADIGEEEPGINDALPDRDLIASAIQLVRMENTCTVSLLQRRLKIGYSRALDVIEELEEIGVVGPYKGSEPREVLPTDLPEDSEEVSDDHDEAGSEHN